MLFIAGKWGHSQMEMFLILIFKQGQRRKMPSLLSCKVGVGKVNRRWDGALLTMNKEEKARLEIEPEWAYRKKRQPDARIPPNSKLTFEVELVDID